MSRSRDEAVTPVRAIADPDFDRTYRELWPQVARVAHLMAGSHAVGEELAQEAFLGLLRRSEPVDNPAGYLRRSVVNAALTKRRRDLFERRYVATLREQAAMPPEVDETWQALRRLPPRQRAVLVLRFYEDLSEAAIAEVLGCRPGTVKSLTSRALSRLRQDLGE
jgi:RNA polymerase sigma factor (sigma-70 family)